ncbi:DUF192 domain-containing protein [Okeania sp. KiyG1]|uniref:DUF192 domain-containing protein n=1 Tax=Okeania sp. KiyG1 TaxID=2720165 RepID=UPI0019233ED8|nr:DUF192 domain-containing protein [Okeania sp. KiyG1]GGA57187.1 hypothetical protein CYANOKiyG1_78210 [Okeania sp. KiyG1]
MPKNNNIQIFLIFSALVIYVSFGVYTNRVRSISRPQYLPVTAEVIINDLKIDLEVADTQKERKIGLMFRPSLPDDRGMLFEFKPPQRVKLWMKNCLISLDIIFIRNSIVQGLVPNAPPCYTDKCSIYDSGVIVDSVIELKGGRANELGLKIGDRLTVTTY